MLVRVKLTRSRRKENRTKSQFRNNRNRETRRAFSVSDVLSIRRFAVECVSGFSKNEIAIRKQCDYVLRTFAIRIDDSPRQ